MRDALVALADSAAAHPLLLATNVDVERNDVA